MGFNPWILVHRASQQATGAATTNLAVLHISFKHAWALTMRIKQSWLACYKTQNEKELEHNEIKWSESDGSNNISLAM